MFEGSVSLLCFIMISGALVNILKDLNMKSFSPLCSLLKFLQSTLIVYNYAFFLAVYCLPQKKVDSMYMITLSILFSVISP